MTPAFKSEGQKYHPKGNLIKARRKGANDIQIPTTLSLCGDPTRDPSEIPGELQGALYTQNYAGIAIPAPRCGELLIWGRWGCPPGISFTWEVGGQSPGFGSRTYIGWRPHKTHFKKSKIVRVQPILTSSGTFFFGVPACVWPPLLWKLSNFITFIKLIRFAKKQQIGLMLPSSGTLFFWVRYACYIVYFENWVTL